MKIINLTKVQYEALKPYEKNILNAYNNSFVHMLASDFSKVAELYADITGEPLTKSQMGCNTCRLNALRKLGEAYSRYGEKEKVKTKSGRPKKLKEDARSE